MTTAQKEAALAADQAKIADATAPKTTTKRASTRKPAGKTTPKVAPKAAPKVVKTAEPSERSQRHDVIAWAVKSVCDSFFALPVKVVKGTKFVTIDGKEIPFDLALYAVKQTCGYTPSTVWDKRLGARDVGRPVSASKSKAA